MHTPRARFGPAAAVLLLVLTLAPALAAPVTLYVSPQGRDTWSGRLDAPNAARSDGPLATIRAARNQVRKLRQSGQSDPVTVTLRGGTYAMAEPLVLEPPDSGVTYAAYRDERPVLSGGLAVTGWRPGANGVWEAEAPRDGRGQVIGFNQLWVNGQRRTLARTPNYAPPGPETPLGSTEGYFTVVRKAPPLRDPVTGQETDRERTAFGYQPGSIKAWPNLDEVHVVLYHSWETSRHRIAAVDETNQVVTFTGPACWSIFYFGRPQRYYVENAPDALDALGEWYLDKPAGVVRYIPLPGEDLTKAEVIVPRLTRLLQMRGEPNAGLWVENVTFRGLSFQYEDWVLEPQGHRG